MGALAWLATEGREARTMKTPLRLAAILLGLLAATLLLSGPPGWRTATAQGNDLDEQLVVDITAPRPGEQLQGSVQITGYAADRRSREGSGINGRDIQIWLDAGPDRRALLQFAPLVGPGS